MCYYSKPALSPQDGKGKSMSKLSWYEKVILALGLAFLLLAGGYRLGGEVRAGPIRCP